MYRSDLVHTLDQNSQPLKLSDAFGFVQVTVEDELLLTQETVFDARGRRSLGMIGLRALECERFGIPGKASFT